MHKSLTIILRTCSQSLLERSDYSRVCGKSRSLMMRKCFRSLAQACSRASGSFNIKLKILDDHSDVFWLNFLQDEIKQFNLNSQIIHLQERGPNFSAHQQFKIASESDGLVFCVEDDYLHEPDAIIHMVNAYNHLSSQTTKDVVIFPFDCIRNYVENGPMTMLMHDGSRYWRSSYKSTNTLFFHSSVMIKHLHVFFRLACEYPHVTEDDTINKLYWSPENTLAPIQLFSPIPSISYHLGYSDISQINIPSTNWMSLWNSTQDWELIQGWFYDPSFYQHIVQQMPMNAILIEVGAWRGRSTCCLASLIKQSRKSMRLYSIDTWEGSDEPVHKEIIGSLNCSLYEDFINNTKVCDVLDHIISLKKTSVDAALLFDNHSVDFVMIDGSHDHESVQQDILAWMPKIKQGGIIAGDDYSISWPGVISAVDGIFDSKVNVIGTTWYVQL